MTHTFLLPECKSRRDELTQRFLLDVVREILAIAGDGSERDHPAHLKSAASAIEDALIRQQKTRMTQEIPNLGIYQMTVNLTAIAARIAVESKLGPSHDQ